MVKMMIESQQKTQPHILLHQPSISRGLGTPDSQARLEIFVIRACVGLPFCQTKGISVYNKPQLI